MDVFLTVYSIMVVETAIHDRPTICVCIDVPGGLNLPHGFSLPLSEIDEWHTHLRFRQAGDGPVVFNQEEVLHHINFYLNNPASDAANRHKFIRDECTFIDGSAGKRTANRSFPC